MVLFKYLRFFIFGLIVAVYSTPLKDLSARQGSCMSLPRVRTPVPQLPPVVLPLTDHLRAVTTTAEDGSDWNENFQRPGHIFRWRAWRGERSVFLQVQARGNIGLSAMYRVVIPRTSTTRDYIGAAGANVNGGGTDEWGNALCVELTLPEGTDPLDASINYSADINLGKIAFF